MRQGHASLVWKTVLGKTALRNAALASAGLLLAASMQAAAAAPASGAAVSDQQLLEQDIDPEPEPTEPDVDSWQIETISEPVIQPIEPVQLEEPLMHWSAKNAHALLKVIRNIAGEGLIPADYRPAALEQAIAAGESDALDMAASKSFSWLAEDLRDGRTPMPNRVQWFVVDPDRDTMPIAQLMAAALTSGDIAGVIAGLAPKHPDYAALRTALAASDPANTERHAAIRANMDRWRWLKQDLGEVYLITNVPEFQLRLIVKNRIIRSYRTIVGKPGRSATPQLSEIVEGVVFNPTWTVPQSIVKGEGLGRRVLGNPGWARAQGYRATRGANGYISVVQQPGPGNALGLMKIDIPNRHAIYFHDTPNKAMFNRDVRAFSHGCIRTERAVELGMTMAILGAQMEPSEAAEISKSGVYTKVAMTRTFPAYITYFTMASDIDGNLTRFNDLYGRDAKVLESFEQPRQLKTSQRSSDEPIIQLDNPL